MKKVLTLMLVLVTIISTVACNGESGDKTSDTNNDVEMETTEKVPEAEMNIADLAGTWESSIWVLPTKLVFNENTTFDYGKYAKGTFTLSDDGSEITLTKKSGYLKYLNYSVFNDYIYTTDVAFDEDADYGLPLTVDENGRSDQTFVLTYIGGKTVFDPDTDICSIQLDLKKDGTFCLIDGYWSSKFNSQMSVTPQGRKGTYSYSDSILTLTYEGKDYPFVVIDGTNYFITYTKR